MRLDGGRDRGARQSVDTGFFIRSTSAQGSCVRRDWRVQASLQINEICSRPSKQFGAFIDFLQKLSCVRSVFFSGKNPTMLFHFTALTHLKLSIICSLRNTHRSGS
ncbi:hypothetical protein WJX73_006038 [Symbiochloris irregularis]|uniref:Uncharacterized protein n=1 Tax=Symbiochloris irregularis TaxID=706552 RepID=A0AAW1NZE1_9CHLO